MKFLRVFRHNFHAYISVSFKCTYPYILRPWLYYNVSSRRMSRSAQVLVENDGHPRGNIHEEIWWKNPDFCMKSWYLFNSTFYDINYISAHLFYNMQSVFRNRESSVVLLVIKYNKKIIYKTCHAVLQTAANNNRDLKIVDARNRIS